jgi:hypothetical protein
MSSGIKQCCAFGRHYVVANLRVGDRSRDDLTEIQESGYKWRIPTLMQGLKAADRDTVQLLEYLRACAWWLVASALVMAGTLRCA